MMRAVLDTDVFIDFLHDRTMGEGLFNDIINEKIIGMVSVMTEAELLSGSECNNAARRQVVEDLLCTCHKIEVIMSIAQKAGELRRTYRTPLIDACIAATAITANAVLFSRNKKDFAPIQELQLKAPY